MRQQVGSGHDIHDQTADARATTLVVPAHRCGVARGRRGAWALAAVALSFAVAACGRFHTGSSTDDWRGTLAAAESRAASREFGAADSILASYAARHPGTPEALETAYWRGLFKLDPSNTTATMPQALASLDGYLRDPRPREHVVEAGTLRRTAARIDALNRAADSASAQAKDAATQAANAKALAADAKADVKAVDANANAAAADKDAEIKRLKDELAKANTELDRIRKRLASPPPPSKP